MHFRCEKMHMRPCPGRYVPHPNTICSVVQYSIGIQYLLCSECNVIKIIIDVQLNHSESLRQRVTATLTDLDPRVG